jgi:hypothetical protein
VLTAFLILAIAVENSSFYHVQSRYTTVPHFGHLQLPFSVFWKKRERLHLSQCMGAPFPSISTNLGSFRGCLSDHFAIQSAQLVVNPQQREDQDEKYNQKSKISQSKSEHRQSRYEPAFQ